jgi:hypothetical protein
MEREARTKRVFILGAGSAKSHTGGVFPGIDEFFVCAKELGITVDLSPSLSARKHYEGLQQFVQQHFGYSVVRAKGSLNIEDVLTHVEIELQRNPSGPLVTVNEQLKELIREVLLMLSERVKGLDATAGEYREFAQRLTYHDTVITFNWDLLLDEALQYEQHPYAAFGDKVEPGGLGMQWTNFLNRFTGNRQNLFHDKAVVFPEPYSEWGREGGFYLKAHGSIDWYSCQNPGCRLVGILFRKNEPRVKYYCAECGEAVVNVLVPPVLNKQLHAYPAIRSIWNAAAREMGIANHLIIWGYSLPATDFYSKWLIRQARHPKLETVSVINPAILSRRKKAYGEYARTVHSLFVGTVDRESLRFYEDFQDYVSGREVHQKYSSIGLRKLKAEA